MSANGKEESAPRPVGSPPSRGNEAWILTSLNRLNNEVGKVGGTVGAIQSSIKRIESNIKEQSKSIDKLKQVIWFASGAVAISFLIGGWAFKGGLESFTDSLFKNFAYSVVEAVEKGKLRSD